MITANTEIINSNKVHHNTVHNGVDLNLISVSVDFLSDNIHRLVLLFKELSTVDGVGVKIEEIDIDSVKVSRFYFTSCIIAKEANRLIELFNEYEESTQIQVDNRLNYIIGHRTNNVKRSDVLESIATNLPSSITVKMSSKFTYEQLRVIYSEYSTKSNYWNKVFLSWVESLPDSELITSGVANVKIQLTKEI